MYKRWSCCFFFQAEDGIRDLVRSRGLGDVYKRQEQIAFGGEGFDHVSVTRACIASMAVAPFFSPVRICLLYTSDAADERSSVDLGGRRIIKKKRIRDYTRVPASWNHVNHYHTG